MLPSLKFSSRKKLFSNNDAVVEMSKEFELTQEERDQLQESKGETIISNRVRWALYYLRRSGLLEGSKKGTYKITEKGIEVLSQNPTEIDMEFLHKLGNDLRLTFVDLQEFILEEMRMQKNYQPVMLKILLENNGKATKEEILAGIKNANKEVQQEDLRNIPVFEVLKNHGVVRKENDYFYLNSQELTSDQKNQLIALTNWKNYDSPLNLEELIIAFNKNVNLFNPDGYDAELIEKEHNMFVERFPIENIVNIKLDEYVAGKPDPQTGGVNRSTFCYLLEFGTDTFGGIGGRQAKKFGIHYDKVLREYIYNKEKYTSVDEAFNKVKLEIRMILEATKAFSYDREWKTFSDVVEGNKYELYRNVRSKIAAIYFPHLFLNVHVPSFMIKILDAFGIQNSDPDRLYLNEQKLIEYKNNHPILKNWNNGLFSHFLWKAIIKRDPAEVSTEHNFWIFVVTEKSEKSLKLTAEQVYQTRMNDKFWGLNKGTKYRNALKTGDQVIFSSGTKSFLGTATLDSNSFELNEQQKNIFGHNNEIYKTDYGVMLSNIVTWDHPKAVVDFADSLSFIRNPRQYGSYFQGGVKKISQSDFNNISGKIDDEIPFDEGYYSLENLEKDTLVKSEVFEEWVMMLKHKNQMILFGPAGTGKTFVAEKFAKYLVSSTGGEYQKIQFHPSYSYEDFVEGIKPTVKDGIITYDVEPGIFKEICDTANKNPGKYYALIIDEINRGQTSRIFGELVNALEYRGNPILLPYSKMHLVIPQNLIVIGTMNSTDRSIAFMDYAIRRRFAFYKLEPSVPILTEWYKNRTIKINLNLIIKLFTDLNSLIKGSLGDEFMIGHSYYMFDGLSKENLKLLWKYTVRPLVEEYFFNNSEKVSSCQDLFDYIIRQIENPQFLESDTTDGAKNSGLSSLPNENTSEEHDT
jgi:hypothetical protein